MNQPRWRLHLALLMLPCAAACQILSCEPPRCALGDVVGACAEDEVCGSDGFCRPAQPSICASAPRVEVTRTMSMDIVDDGLGVEAMGDELFGRVPAAFVADVRGCSDEGGRPNCPEGVARNPAVVQPLGALSAAGATAFTPLVQRNVLVLPHDPIDLSQGFAFEALFRTPTSGATTRVASMIDGDPDTSSGWHLSVIDGISVLAVADVVVGLAGRSDATWMHVLCTVDARVARSERDDDDVICAVDGRLAFLPAVAIDAPLGRGLGSGNAPLVLGAREVTGPVEGDAATAVVRIWPGDVYAAAQIAGGTLARSDALVYEARRRLSRYVGLRISVPANELRFLLTNLDVRLPRAQPVEHGGLRRHELVGGGWPRVTHTAQGLPGLLLEPDRFDLLEGAFATCSGKRTVLLGRPDACPLTTTLVKDVAVDRATGTALTAEQPLVFSVFSDGPLELTVDGRTVCTNAANFEGCVLEPWEDAQRLVYRFLVPDPAALPIAVTLRSGAGANIWSPQLEAGADPTTPMNMLTRDNNDVLTPIGLRLGDKVLLTGVGLAAGSRTSLRAKVASDGSSIFMSPVLVGDGGARLGRSVELQVGAADDEEIKTRVFVSEDEATLEFADANTFSFSGGVPVRVGVDVGEPLAGCPDCAVTPLQLDLAAPAQWDFVGFFGLDQGEPGIVVEADVATQGLEPLPIELLIDVAAPGVGCAEGQPADISLVACASGACSESDSQIWQGEATASEPGPSLDELAVAGAFELPLPDLVVDALLVEVRLRTSAAGGSIFSLIDAEGVAVLEVSDEDGDAVLASGSGTAIIPGAWANDDEWTQLTCWVGARLRCAVNAGVPALLEGELGVAGRVIARARVGEGAAAVAFARAWLLSSQLGPVDEERIADARTAASFGFQASLRRGPFTIVELRPSATTVERDGATLTVGAHWPRVLDQDGPVYLANADEGLRVAASEVASGLGLGFTLAASFSNVGDGRFLAIVDERGPPVEAFSAFSDLGRLRFTMAGSDGPLAINDSAAFDGHELLVAVRLFAVVVESDGVPAFTAVPAIMRGGQAVVVGNGPPLGLRRLRIVSE